MNDLASRHCVPCEGGTPPLPHDDAERLAQSVPDWTLDAERKSITRAIKLKSFKDAIAFVDAVADVAEAEDHHPDIFIRYRQVTFTLSTHAIGGLSENDFILAAKIDRLYRERFSRAPAGRAEA